MKKNIFKILLLLVMLFVFIKIFNFEGDFGDVGQQIKDKFKEHNYTQEHKPIVRNESLPDEDIQREFQGNGDDIIALVNSAREEEGLLSVKKNEKLMQSALAKAEDMKAKNYFEHVSPEGLQPWFFAEKVDYKYKNFGENLAEGFFVAEEVHEGWMNSPGHRENIMNKDFEEIGVGIVGFEQNGLQSFLLVQHFGTVFREVDLKSPEPLTVCDKKIKESCKDAKKKKKEVEDVIEDQEDEIDKAEKVNASKDVIDEMEDNLEELKETEDEIEEYLDECKDYKKDCDEWE